jgi:hypothetical protein
VRWAVAATAQGGAASRDPAPEEEKGGYKGTVVEAPRPAGALPVLHWCGWAGAGTFVGGRLHVACSRRRGR